MTRQIIYLFSILLLLTSCNAEKNQKQIKEDSPAIVETEVKTDSIDTNITEENPEELLDRETVIEKKEKSEEKAEEQLKEDLEKSDLNDTSCDKIFETYEQLILKAKETKSKEDRRKLNEYRKDPNFNKCRKLPENKEIYNRLEKLKKSKQ